MSNKARGLGRGLGALIPELETAESEGRLEIAIADIKPNPFQPRREFDPEKLAELAGSIKEHGILQPVLLRRVEGGYQLVAGERRLRAAELAGLTRVPAVIGDYPDMLMMQIALVENLQRENLNPIEEAEAFRRLLDEFGLTQEEIAQKVGKSRSAIANTLRLLSLPVAVREDLRQGRATAGHARAILGLPAEEGRLEAWQEITSGGLSVRETEELIRRRANRSVSRETKKPAAKDQDADLKAAEDQIREALGTKVRLQGTRANGRIEIEYYSLEELNRILELILR